LQGVTGAPGPEPRSGTGRSGAATVPLILMLSSHQPSSPGTAAHPSPSSWYELEVESNAHELAIHRMRTRCPRYLLRSNLLSTQPPEPLGSSEPGPAQSPTSAAFVPITLPQCDHAPRG